jgi:Probable zinc-ribbon domain
MSEYNDQQLTCADCNRDFTWTAGEQEFFNEKGFTNPPKRCKECRQAKKEQRGGGGGERKGGRD